MRPGESMALHVADTITLQSGATIGPVTLAYETYGTLNDKRSNAILVCHGLSGNAHVAAQQGAGSQDPGWWDAAVGPGKAFDTDRLSLFPPTF